MEKDVGYLVQIQSPVDANSVVSISTNVPKGVDKLTLAKEVDKCYGAAVQVRARFDLELQEQKLKDALLNEVQLIDTRDKMDSKTNLNHAEKMARSQLDKDFERFKTTKDNAKAEIARLKKLIVELESGPTSEFDSKLRLTDSESA